MTSSLNLAFKEFWAFSPNERADVFRAAAQELNTRASYVEKDFWVCLTLDILYNGLPGERPQLLFKGGTSLSKGYGLIKRFSEDVDFTVFREGLGLGDQPDLASRDLSKRERKSLADEIKKRTSEYICDLLSVDLRAAVQDIAPECQVSIDDSDRDNSTLLLEYPSLFDPDSYLQPRVKLEGGGRSALDPCEVRQIEPYITETLQEWDFTVDNVTTILPQRTFWDKVFILHGWYCGHRDQDRLPNDRQRLSRHYYDVYMIGRSETGRDAIANADLREDVRIHTKRVFPRGWWKLDEAVPGSIKLRPSGQLAKSLAADYSAMQGMMLGEAPDFHLILDELSLLEEAINQQLS